jgi:NAD+ synthase
VLGRLVLGTGDRSEALVGYFTKYGDGGVDLLPLGGLYKTQVRALGQFLGIAKNVLEKQSSPRLWLGHDAEEELGFAYETLDLILYGLFDLRMPPRVCARAVGTDAAKVERVIAMHRQTAHKRKVPPVGPVVVRG